MNLANISFPVFGIALGYAIYGVQGASIGLAITSAIVTFAWLKGLWP